MVYRLLNCNCKVQCVSEQQMMKRSSMKIIPVLRLFTKVDKCLFFSIWLMFMVAQSQRVNGCLKKADNANETKIESFVGKASDVRVNRNCNFNVDMF